MATTDRDNDAQHGIAFQIPASPPVDAEVFSERMEEPPIKFEIPDNCRTFSPFPRLPPELRHQIWEATLTTPGMHFLKVDTEYEPSSGRGRWWIRDFSSPHDIIEDDDDENADPVAIEVKRESRPISVQYGSLRPLYPTRQADISYYTSLHQQLAKLSVTCNEAAAIAKSLAGRSDTFRLDNGRIISLGCSSDVIYLEYVPPDVFESGFRFFRSLHCEGLDQIRKVAVRYCHKWNEQRTPRRCPNCGQLHPSPDVVKHPNHIYRFLAQYLPNLEQFYFVDYFILRKTDTATQPTGEGNDLGVKPRANPQSRTFQGGNRTYCEVNDHDWNVRPVVWDMKSWLQEQFVKYAKTSKLSKHRNPEKVQFGVLACEWTVGPPTEATRGPITPVKKGHNKRRLSEDHSPSRSRRLNIQRASATPPQNLPQEATRGFAFVFGAREEASNEFDFTISIPL
ncbi:2EXR domain-containing protein [Fusarium sp. Ph1]|nr:2EXR domain-containing protein [Fusarium sp. Ph1]